MDMATEANEYCFLWPCLYVTFSGTYNKVYITRCCVKKGFSERIFESSIEDFKSIQNKYLFFNSLVNVWTENIDTVWPDFCKPKVCFSKNKLSLEEINIMINYECNIHCQWCDAKKEKDKIVDRRLLNETYFETLYQLKNTPLKRLRLTDRGEPFFFKDKICNYLSSLTLADFEEVSIFTNATLVDEKVLSIIKSSPLHYFINVSLNAWDRKSYIEVTGKDYFNHVLDTIFKLKNLNNVTLQVSFVYDNDDFYSPLSKMRDYFSKLGVKTTCFKAKPL